MDPLLEAVQNKATEGERIFHVNFGHGVAFVVLGPDVETALSFLGNARPHGNSQSFDITESLVRALSDRGSIDPFLAENFDVGERPVADRGRLHDAIGELADEGDGEQDDDDDEPYIGFRPPQCSLLDNLYRDQGAH